MIKKFSMSAISKFLWSLCSVHRRSANCHGRAIRCYSGADMFNAGIVKTCRLRKTFLSSFVDSLPFSLLLGGDFSPRVRQTLEAVTDVLRLKLVIQSLKKLNAVRVAQRGSALFIDSN